MAKGQQSKDMIMKVLNKEFPNAFMNGKEFRIPCIENGEEVQIKITLTAAKECVPHDGAAEASAFDWSSSTPVKETVFDNTPSPKVAVSVEPVKIAEPTQEEKDNLQKLLSSLF